MIPDIGSFDRKYLSLDEIQKVLKKCNVIKYAAYRAASKLRILQKTLFMDRVPLKVITCIFHRHQLQQTENFVNLAHTEIESLLSDIFFAVQVERNVKVDENYLYQLIIEVLLCIYNKKEKNTVSVLSCKVLFVLLSQAKPIDKYHYLFNQLCDHNNCLSRSKLKVLLKSLVSIMNFLGEEPTFGSQLIAGTIESCFQTNNGALGITEDDYIAWLMKDPQMLVWVSTLYRIQISELVSHNAKCEVCKAYPIVGLRYRCLRCLSYDMCQTCFFIGNINKKHKLKHPIQEYCCQMTTQQFTRAFLLTLKNILYKRNYKLQYLPALSVNTNELDSLWCSTQVIDCTPLYSKELDCDSISSMNKFSFIKLQSIMQNLERESEKLVPVVENLCKILEKLEVSSSQKGLKLSLLKHKSQIEEQARRLKLLKIFLISSKHFEEKTVVASTPVVNGFLSKNKKKQFNQDLENLSPITISDFKYSTDVTSDKKLLWDNYDFANFESERSWEEILNDANDHSNILFESRNRPINEDEICLSTLLGGEDLNESLHSSNTGLSWLRQNGNSSFEKNKNKQLQNESAFEELESDLNEIVRKLKELPVDTIPKSSDDMAADNMFNELTIPTPDKVDSLFQDLIRGIEKIVGKA